jgi:hypothetical protein
MIMKANFYGLFWACLGALVFTSCSNDDDDLRLSDVPTVVQDSFELRFPNVDRAEWEYKKGYIVADFWQDGMETQAWYNPDGEWLMTEYDLGINVKALPQAVQNALQDGQYATWRVDDIDKYERENEVFYLIDVETQGQQDRDLYFSPDGELLKDEVDKENDDVTPDTIL